MADEPSPLISVKPIPDAHLSLMERFAAWIILSALILFIGAVVGNDLVPGNTLSETVQTNFLDPLNQDSTQGDAGYNPVDTVAYSVLLVSFVVVISAWLRKMGFPESPRAKPDRHTARRPRAGWLPPPATPIP